MLHHLMVFATWLAGTSDVPESDSILISPWPFVASIKPICHSYTRKLNATRLTGTLLQSQRMPLHFSQHIICLLASKMVMFVEDQFWQDKMSFWKCLNRMVPFELWLLCLSSGPLFLHFIYSIYAIIYELKFCWTSCFHLLLLLVLEVLYYQREQLIHEVEMRSYIYWISFNMF